MLIIPEYPEAYIECNGEREDDTCDVRCPDAYVGPETVYTCMDDTSWYSDYPLDCFAWYLWTLAPENVTDAKESRYGKALDIRGNNIVIGAWGHRVFT